VVVVMVANVVVVFAQQELKGNFFWSCGVGQVILFF